MRSELRYRIPVMYMEFTFIIPLVSRRQGRGNHIPRLKKRRKKEKEKEKDRARVLSREFHVRNVPGLSLIIMSYNIQGH